MTTVNIAPRFTKTFYVENPVSSDDDPSFFTVEPLTVTQLTAVLRNPSSPPGTPQVDWTVRYGSDRDAAGTEIITGGVSTTDDTTGDVETTLDNENIPANSWVWLELTTVTTGGDAPNSFSLTLEAKAS